jgi:predicted HD phosphohydrolase
MVVMGVAANLTLDEIVDLLATGAQQPLCFGSAVSQLNHVLQVAALLRHEYPEDDELAVAGLVHDLGHLLPGVGDDLHAGAAANAVRATLGERVAELVELHVDAKRFLVTTETDYGNLLSEDSVASMREQGGPMSADEAASFSALPLAEGAIALRRADDGGKADGVVVADLSSWVPVLRRVAQAHAAAAR